MGASGGEGKTTGEHVARRTKATVDKLPRRREERGAEGDGQGEEGRRGRGRVLMEEMLEVFRVRREQGREGLKGLSEKLQVEERDLEELVRFTRGILGRRDPDGVVRGYSDPAHSVERFEDEEGTRPEKQARGA